MKRLVALLSPLLLWTTGALAATGSVSLEITGYDGRPLANASVVVESRAGESWTATTDANGQAVVAELDAGLYELTVELAGFVDVVEPSLRIVRDKTIPFRLQMRPADEALDEVVVLAQAVKADALGAVSSSYLDREDLRTAVGSGADVLRALDGLPASGEFKPHPTVVDLFAPR